MTVWIEAPFDSLPMEGYRKQRYWLMAEAFVRAGHRVVYWTSDFSHARKERRSLEAKVNKGGFKFQVSGFKFQVSSFRFQVSGFRFHGEGERGNGQSELELVMIPTRPYRKNVSWARVRSHRAYAKEWERAALAFVAQSDNRTIDQSNNSPDLIIVSAPPVSTGLVGLKLARRFGARFVVDVQDAWPETFYRLLPRGFRWIAWLALSGVRRAMRRVYRQASLVTGVCDRYAALVKGYGAKDYYRAYLGFQEEGFRFQVSGFGFQGSGFRGQGTGDRGQVSGGGFQVSGDRRQRTGDGVRLAYVGNLGKSYDLKTVVEGVALLNRQGIAATLDVAGFGGTVEKNEFVRFHGMLKEGELREMLAQCDLGVIPMTADSFVGIPNKLAEYAAAGLRIVSSLEGESAKLLTRYGCGIGYRAGDAESFAAAVREAMRLPADAGRRLVEQELAAETIYDAYCKRVCTQRIVHFCAGLTGNNGMANTARQFVAEEIAAGHESEVTNDPAKIVKGVDEVMIHGAWLPVLWRAAKRAKAVGAKLVIRPAGSYDPVRLAFHGWKKRLVAFFEHRMLRRADVVLATCEAERKWIRAYEPRAKKIEITDLKRFFRFDVDEHSSSIWTGRPLHILYLGRRHPLKGVEFLEKAVDEVKTAIEQSNNPSNRTIDLRIVSDHFGEELEKDWTWCDVLVLPTLSENFGRVVAEALERGKRVITTDGAPAWAPEEAGDEAKGQGEGEQWRERLVYLKGYRDGTDGERVELLKNALECCIG